MNRAWSATERDHPFKHSYSGFTIKSGTFTVPGHNNKPPCDLSDDTGRCAMASWGGEDRRPTRARAGGIPLLYMPFVICPQLQHQVSKLLHLLLHTNKGKVALSWLQFRETWTAVFAEHCHIPTPQNTRTNKTNPKIKIQYKGKQQD